MWSNDYPNSHPHHHPPTSIEITRSLFQDNSFGIYVGDISRAAIADTVSGTTFVYAKK